MWFIIDCARTNAYIVLLEAFEKTPKEEIHTVGLSKPVKQPPRKVPMALADEEREERSYTQS